MRQFKISLVSPSSLCQTDCDTVSFYGNRKGSFHAGTSLEELDGRCGAKVPQVHGAEAPDEPPAAADNCGRGNCLHDG